MGGTRWSPEELARLEKLLAEDLLPPPECAPLLARAIFEEPAALVRDGGVIATGFDAELDELRAIQENADGFLVQLEVKERERTGIANLRVQFNKVHGFYIEVTQGQLDKVPDDYRRRQTLKNAERFITPELKAFEDKALSAQERALGGRRHSKRRDAEAIHHHYDVSNTFYSMVLGPSMAYTCAVFPNEEASLELAQEEKFDLVCRKLDLQPGMTLLDIGCGWGGMVMHAAEHYGVKAIGVTLSKEQAAFAQNAIKERGLSDRAEVRFSDYRDVPETGFDAISSIGLTEHIGRANYPSYFSVLYGKLREEGLEQTKSLNGRTRLAPALAAMRPALPALDANPLLPLAPLSAPAWLDPPA